MKYWESSHRKRSDVNDGYAALVPRPRGGIGGTDGGVAALPGHKRRDFYLLSHYYHLTLPDAVSKARSRCVTDAYFVNH